MRLNLGCGNKPGTNDLNHDKTLHSPHVDIAWDLDELPWPWKDEEFDAIIARSVLEHLRLSLIESVNECWRILKPEGALFIKLPFWNSSVSYQEPTHRWFFDPRVFEYFDPTTPLGAKYFFYTPFKWRLREPAKLNRGKTSIHGTLIKVALEE